MFQKVLDTSNFVTFGKSSIKYLLLLTNRLQPSVCLSHFFHRFSRRHWSHCFLTPNNKTVQSDTQDSLQKVSRLVKILLYVVPKKV